MMFLIRLGGRGRTLDDMENVSIGLRSNTKELCSAHGLATHGLAKGSRGLVTGVLVHRPRERNGWYMCWHQEFSPFPDASISDRMSMIRKILEKANQDATIAELGQAWGPVRQNQIMQLERSGKFTEATECQKELIQLLDVHSDDPRWELLLGQELQRLDKLQGRVAIAQEQLKATISQSPPRRNQVEIPFTPLTGSMKGGTFIQWTDDRLAPMEMQIAGRPCATLDGGVFVAPMSFGAVGPQTVTVLFADSGHDEKYADAFAYWRPGEILAVDPNSFPSVGYRKVHISTTDLGSPISEVRIAGIECKMDGAPSNSEVDVVVPAVESEGGVQVIVKAENGNSAVSMPHVFSIYRSQSFRYVGENIHLSDDHRTATRHQGVFEGVCIGTHALRMFAEGRYFELAVQSRESTGSTKTLAVGFTAASPDKDILDRKGFVRHAEARALTRTWLAGYERGGAVFVDDGEESRIDPKAWRPVKDVREGSKIGVLLDNHANLVIFQDGVEKVRRNMKNNVPNAREDVFAVVDLQGLVKCVKLSHEAYPPKPCIQLDDEDVSETTQKTSNQ